MENGFHVGIFNNEGINNTPILNHQIAHFKSTSSLTQALIFTHNKFPSLSLYIAGVSMGASRATKCLSKIPNASSFVKGFISVSNPFNLEETANTLSHDSKNYLYNYFFMRSYLNYFKKHCGHLEQESTKKAIDLSTISYGIASWF